ncbi:MAG: ribbon-helix-helix protein, CopG family [Ktedonobacteraceae bacterium]
MPDVNQVQPRRIAATLAPSTYEALQELANSKGVSMADALRDAIALSKWFKDTQDSGVNILIEKNGRMERVLKL